MDSSNTLKLFKYELIKLSNEEREYVKCCVINCQTEIPVEDAIIIEEKYFCKLCGVAYYKSYLNL